MRVFDVFSRIAAVPHHSGLAPYLRPSVSGMDAEHRAEERDFLHQRVDRKPSGHFFSLQSGRTMFQTFCILFHDISANYTAALQRQLSNQT
jgi:hypothetical protein